MFGVLLTLWAFIFAQASTLEMSDCTACEQPESVIPYTYWYETVVGYTLVDGIGHRFYGVATYVKQGIDDVTVVHKSSDDDIFVLAVKVSDFTIVNVYKPPNIQWPDTVLPIFEHPVLYTGDFNSHHSQWGYSSDDINGIGLASWSTRSSYSDVVSQVNDGLWKFLIVPDVDAYKHVKAQEFQIVRKNESRTDFFVTIAKQMEDGTVSYVAKNEELTDMGKGVTSIKSGKDSPIEYELSTAVVWSSDTCFAYSACSPTGNDQENLWIFTACICELSKKDESEVLAVYEKYGAPYKKLEASQYC